MATVVILRVSQRDHKDKEKSRPRREGPERRKLVVDRLSGKVSKEESNYRDAKETETKEMCAECVHYLQPGNNSSDCRRVAGVVYGEDTCDLFSARP